MLYMVKAHEENNVGQYAKSMLASDQKSTLLPPISTGFSSLDEALGGGFYEELVCLGAATALGKTSLALQMVDSIVKQGHDVLFLSMEMSRRELIGKSISRETLLHTLEEDAGVSKARTMRGVMLFRGSQRDADSIRNFSQAVERYCNYAADHLYIHEGTADFSISSLRKMISEHVNQKGKTPVVVVDYLQILAPLHRA